MTVNFLCVSYLIYNVTLKKSSAMVENIVCPTSETKDLYEYFCSLGFVCFSSELLQRNKLKTKSYPFDWVFSYPALIIDCIENNFENFMNPKNLTRDKDSTTNTNTFYFKDHITMFHHQNPLEENKCSYFQRCIDRFYELLKSRKRKLFVVTILEKSVYPTNNPEDFHSVVHLTENDIMDFNNQIKKYTENYTLLCIFQSVTGSQNHTFNYTDNIHFLHIDTIEKARGAEFYPADNFYLDKIIKEKYGKIGEGCN